MTTTYHALLYACSTIIKLVSEHTYEIRRIPLHVGRVAIFFNEKGVEDTGEAARASAQERGPARRVGALPVSAPWYSTDHGG